MNNELYTKATNRFNKEGITPMLIEDLKEAITFYADKMDILKSDIVFYDVEFKVHYGDIFVLTAVAVDKCLQIVMFESAFEHIASDILASSLTLDRNIKMFHSFGHMIGNELLWLAQCFGKAFIVDNPEKFEKYNIGANALHVGRITKGFYNILRKAFLRTMIEKYKTPKPSFFSTYIKQTEDRGAKKLLYMRSIDIAKHGRFFMTLNKDLLKDHVRAEVVHGRALVEENGLKRYDHFIQNSKLFRLMAKDMKTTECMYDVSAVVLAAVPFNTTIRDMVAALFSRLKYTRLERIAAWSISRLLCSYNNGEHIFGRFLYLTAMAGNLQDKSIRKARKMAVKYHLVKNGTKWDLFSIYLRLEELYSHSYNVRAYRDAVAEAIKSALLSRNLSKLIECMHRMHPVFVQDGRTEPEPIDKSIKKIENHMRMFPLPEELSSFKDLFLADTADLQYYGSKYGHCLASHASNGARFDWYFHHDKAVAQVSLIDGRFKVMQCYGPYDERTPAAVELEARINEVIEGIRYTTKDIKQLELIQKEQRKIRSATTFDRVKVIRYPLFGTESDYSGPEVDHDVSEYIRSEYLPLPEGFRVTYSCNWHLGNILYKERFNRKHHSSRSKEADTKRRERAVRGDIFTFHTGKGCRQTPTSETNRAAVQQPMVVDNRAEVADNRTIDLPF